MGRLFLLVPFLMVLGAPVQAQDTTSTTDVAWDDVLASPGDSAQVTQAIASTSVQSASYDTFIAAVHASGFAAELESDGPWTLFASTDEAFAVLPNGYVDGLLEPGARAELVAQISYHIVPEAFDAQALAGMVDGIGVQTAIVPTIDGHMLAIGNRVGITVDGASVVQPDLESASGVVHGIDTVLLPDAT